jgi:DNA-binding NarL/FixJ family response regulator
VGSLPDMEVVGEASSGEQAVELARELQPDVILMDIKMPGINGIEATREILHISPRIGVLVVTMSRATTLCSPLCEPGQGATY